jgi:hypothetical protein
MDWPNGPSTTERDTPIEALSGIDTLAKGHADVVIVHLSKDDKAYAPTDFAKFYSDTRN